MLEELRESLADKGYRFSYDDAVAAQLVKSSYSATYGARNLRRQIQRELEDPMASLIINSYDHPVTQITAAVEDGKIKLNAQ